MNPSASCGFFADPAVEHQDYAPALTGLRGVAALWVFLYHAWVFSQPRLMLVNLAGTTLDFTPLFSIGWVGVDIFFVLSGFLISMPYVRAGFGRTVSPSTVSFLRRRVLRVFPAYWVQLLLLASLGWLGIYGLSLSPTEFLRSAFMLFNIGPWSAVKMNDVWWTLPVEFGFYLMVPLLGAFMRPSRWLWLLAGAIVWTLAWRIGMFQLIANQSVQAKVVTLESVYGRMDQFILGVAMAVLHTRLRMRGKALPATWANALLIVGMLGLGILMWILHITIKGYWSGNFWLFVWHTLTGVSIAAMVLGVAQGAPIGQAMFGNRPIWFVGLVSYSFYLWHYPVQEVLIRSGWMAMEGYSLLPLLAISGSVTLIVATLSWRWIERPALRLR